jgi:hypothetical protein
LTEAKLHLLVTTHVALLRVTLDCQAGNAAITVLHDSCPVYFGVTAAAGGMLVAARNVGLDFRVVTPGLPCNAIWRLADGASMPEQYIVHPVLFDLHQIQAVGNWLFVVIGRGSQLAVFDIATRQLVRCFDLQSVLPPELRRSDRPADPYHFNSISFASRRLYVLAHNWLEGSFALELVFDPEPGQPPVLALHAIHRALGHASHDVVSDRGTLFVLDGEGAALIARGHPAGRAALPGGESKPYPRGLIVLPDRLIVGCGTWSAERAERAKSPTRLCVLDRQSLELRQEVELGPFGNPCALALVGAPPIDWPPDRALVATSPAAGSAARCAAPRAK